MRAHSHRRQRQRGVAVITALLLTTLAVTIVASLFWQQQVQVRSMENQRLHLQTKWILRGALDWARLVLRQDGFDNQVATTLDGVWATPLAETRLDQYIERERVEGESFDATLSGHIVDAQSRYNLAALAGGGAVVPGQVEVYKHLLENLQLDGALAQRTAEAMARTQPANSTLANPVVIVRPGAQPGDGEPLEFKQLDDLLAIPGYTAEIVAKLREFAIVLPEPKAVNVNTAPPEVLSALVVGMSVSEAAALVYKRKQAYFRDVGYFKGLLNNKSFPANVTVEFKSEYFLATSKVRLDRATLDAEALIHRQNGNGYPTTLVWIRQY
ncbi:MAG: type II secretion system minor pseudopilin GspK [Pseudomonadota bacterium]